ncbi:hypothetical protein QCA50_003942 [Cerrena zonata]|uniref:Uncharacterized protein n=1 Tax=Cerrena zonata TaxID=2478898 RepID=A0AAW0GI00_9APHY
MIPEYQVLFWKPADCTRSPSKLRVKKALELLDPNASDDHPEQRVKDLLRTLLRRAIEEHGYASRDVFSAIFCPREMDIKIQNALAELSKDLLKVMRVSGVISSTPAFNSPSQELIAISPIQPVYLELSDTFAVEFKSVAIRREIIKRLAAAGQEKIRKVFDVHRGTMTSTVLSGWVVKCMAHNISRGIPSRFELFGGLVPMCTEDGTPETAACFCTTDPSRRPPQFTLRKREYASVRFKNHKQRSVSASPWPQIIRYSTSLLRLR